MVFGPSTPTNDTGPIRSTHPYRQAISLLEEVGHDISDHDNVPYKTIAEKGNLQIRYMEDDPNPLARFEGRSPRRRVQIRHEDSLVFDELRTERPSGTYRGSRQHRHQFTYDEGGWQDDLQDWYDETVSGHE